jgi:hypothetical protein
MDDLDRRLLDAAEETRQATRTMSAPPLQNGRARGRNAGAVFAIAFAVVLVVGIAPLLLNGEGGERDATTISLATPTTPHPNTSLPAVACSGAGADTPPEVTGLPDQVSDIRQAIIDAAAACDFVTLVGLAGEDLTTSFGGGGPEAFEAWEAEGEGKMGVLLRLLATDHAVQTFEGDAAEALGSSILYVWPAAFARDSWEEITDKEMADLLTIYTQEELDQIAAFGSYAGWRIGITAEGDWVFFVAGD